jgi:hypothetical protein
MVRDTATKMNRARIGLGKSVFSLHQESRQAYEAITATAKVFDGLGCGLEQRSGLLLRLVESKQRRIGGFFRGKVFSGGLS